MNQYAQFGTVIIDEVHTICTDKSSKAFHVLQPTYMIGLSATPERSDGMDALLTLYLGSHRIERRMKRAFHAYKLNTGFVPSVSYSQDGSMIWGSVLTSQAEDQQRNILLCKLAWYFGKRTILILVKLTKHAERLQLMLRALGEDVDVFMENMKKVNYGSRILIATYSKGGVGFDHPKLDMLIGAADVEENFMQYLGRVFRRDDVMPIYIDVRDKLGTLERHSKTRLEICEQVGGHVFDFNKTFKRWKTMTDHLSWV